MAKINVNKQLTKCKQTADLKTKTKIKQKQNKTKIKQNKINK